MRLAYTLQACYRGPMDRDPAPPRPTLAQLLGRCDLARLHPDRLRRNCERWNLADTEGVLPAAPQKEEPRE